MSQFDNVQVTPAMGRRLAHAREERRMSRRELADQLDASEIQIEKYEHGTLDMPIDRLFKMAEILGVPAGELLV